MKFPLMSVYGVLMLTLAGCESIDGNSHNKSNDLSETDWRLSAWSASSLDPSKFTITAAFDGRQISGTSAVNSYSGTYSASGGGAFSVGSIQSTLMAGSGDAMRAEQIYFALLDQARHYTVSESALTLLDGGNNVLLVFVPGGRAHVNGPAVITRADNGGVVTVSKGASVQAVLPGNPTTGYEWTLTETDPARLPLADSSYARNSDLIGAGGAYQFRFSAQNTGDVKLRLAYKRSWETGTAESFTVTVRIR